MSQSEAMVVDKIPDIGRAEIVPPIVREFVKALGRYQTYDIQRNGYFIFGILWGLPVPLVTIGMGLYYGNLTLSVNSIINVIISNPIQIFFLIHPILFGIVFGAMGTVRYDKEKQRLEFQENLIETNDKLKGINAQLQELDELKDNFLSMASHELWTPLTTVRGYVTFLTDGKAGKLTEEQKELLSITEEQIENLNNLIGDLVDISKLESGKFDVNPDIMDMKALVSRVLEVLKVTADEKKITLNDNTPSVLPHVLADKKRMAQVLTNLIGNAIKFTPEGGSVSVSAAPKGNKIEFAVSDTGIGIQEEHIDKIFDKFYQVDSSGVRKYGGCGLGLAITKSIVELHGGKIWIKSEPEEGSKFFFELKKDLDKNEDYAI